MFLFFCFIFSVSGTQSKSQMFCTYEVARTTTMFFLFFFFLNEMQE